MRYSDWSIARMSNVDCIAHVLLLFFEASTSDSCITVVTHGWRAGVAEVDNLGLGGAVSRLICCGPFSLKAAAAARDVLVGKCYI